MTKTPPTMISKAGNLALTAGDRRVVRDARMYPQIAAKLPPAPLEVGETKNWVRGGPSARH